MRSGEFGRAGRLRKVARRLELLALVERLLVVFDLAVELARGLVVGVLLQDGAEVALGVVYVAHVQVGRGAQHVARLAVRAAQQR